MFNGLGSAFVENIVFVLEFILIVAVLFAIAYIIEKSLRKKEGNTDRILNTKTITVVGVFSAISAVLMLFEIPLPFAPSFYKLDFSEIPALIGAFSLGPVAGVLIEFIKIILKLFIKGTSTAFVGELANFAVGCSFILPASIIYLYGKTKKGALIGCCTGTVILTIFGTSFNAIYLLPKFAQLFGMPLEVLIEMGTKINPNITNVLSFVCFAVAPLNLIKGSLVSLVTILVYKKISNVIKHASSPTGVKKNTNN